MTRVGESGARIAQLVEEGVDHGIDGREPLGGGILEEARDQLDGVLVGLAEDFAEGVGLDLGKFVLHVVGVHGADLIAGRGA